MSQVVHSVMPRDRTQLATLRSLPEGARCVELRGDAYDGPPEDLLVALDAWRADGVETIFTVRSVSQGGEFQGSREELRSLQRRAIGLCDWIDVEWDDAAPPTRSQLDAPWVLSWHDLEGTPRDLEDRTARMLAAGDPRTHVKLAVTPTDHGELCRLLELPGRHRDRRITALGMGARGLTTRVLAPRTGCAISFGRPEHLAPTGPGQPSTRELLEGYDFESWGESTRLGLVVGKPVAHSLSPWLHHRAYQSMGLDRRLVPLEVDEFSQALEFADRWGADVMAVTMPFKDAARAAARAMRAEADEAEGRGAANGLRRDGDGWVAASTDGVGVCDALREAGALSAGTRVLVLGAGGAARAAAAALLAAGARVTIAARRGPAAVAAAATTGADPAELDTVDTGAFDVVLNGTPLGMSGADPSPLGEERLYPHQVVMDMIYRPVDTPLLQAARRRGAREVPGAAMFLHQALHQIRWFVDREPPLELLRQTLDAELAAPTDPENPAR